MSSAGAVPEVRLAELDSAQHHLRDQVDRDRRANAERRQELRRQIDRIEAKTTKHGEAIAGIGSSVKTIKWLVGVAIALAPISIGAAWALGRLIR